VHKAEAPPKFYNLKKKQTNPTNPTKTNKIFLFTETEKNAGNLCNVKEQLGSPIL
jgi:hypothetical protein